MATKTSILIFYLSLSKTNKIFRWATIITLVVVNVGGLALTFLNIFQCSPVRGAFYSPEQLPQKCTSIVTIYLSSAPLNIITDLAIFFLPMPLLTGMYVLFCPLSSANISFSHATTSEAKDCSGRDFRIRNLRGRR